MLAALTDRLVALAARARWSRRSSGSLAYIVDLARGSPLIIRSLLGPNPLFGSRFYGIGNELEATLPVLLFDRPRRAAATGAGARAAPSRRFAGGGLVLGVAIGSGRLGADVGGVITVGAGAAVAALLMLPGGAHAARGRARAARAGRWRSPRWPRSTC